MDYFEKLLLDQNQQRKIQIFSVFLEEPVASKRTKRLKAELDVSTPTRIQLESEVKTHFEQIVTVDKSPRAAYSEYIALQLDQAVAYQFVLFCLDRHNRTVNDFCEQFFVSLSTLQRRVEPLRSALKEFDLSINVGKGLFLGDEKKIRLFIFDLFYQLGQRGVVFPSPQLPFEEKLYQEIVDLFPFENELYRDKITKLGIKVTFTRIKHGFFAPSSRKYAVLAPMVTQLKTGIMAEALKEYPANIQTQEIQLFCFFTMLGPFFHNDSEKVRKIYQLFHSHSNPSVLMARKFYRFIKKTSPSVYAAVSQNNIFLTNLYCIFYAFYVFGGTFPNLQYFLLTEKFEMGSYFKYLTHEIRQFVEAGHDSKSFLDMSSEAKEFLIGALSYVLIPYLEHRPKKLRLYFDTEYDYFFYQSFISSIIQLKFVGMVRDPQIADVIITDRDMAQETKSLDKSVIPFRIEELGNEARRVVDAIFDLVDFGKTIFIGGSLDDLSEE
ncbi:MAG: helix-turn-helix domain-containing protein [Streptococcaceae bacterium]|jgi:hypothetical protein|nr:helix-turn-helix domain-containing protein [Streptococcaceae bacterium]